MKYLKLKHNASTYQSNIRAEDGVQQDGRWSALYDEILVPCGFILILLLILLSVMLIRN